MKPIAGYEGLYSITMDGDVWSHERRIRFFDGPCGRLIKGNWLKPYLNSSGYALVKLSRDGVAEHRFIHHLVADAFVDNPFDKPQVNHLNLDKLDNRAENLEYCTASENIRHARGGSNV